MSDAVLVTKENGIMTITLNRPDAKNAINLEVSKGVAAAMEELDSNGELRVAVLTGAGNTFCAGMDLKAFVTGELPFVPGRGFAGLVEKLPKKPLIGAVEGFALAGGFEIALCCDLLVAADNARFGVPEVKRGLAAGAGGLMRAPKQIPPRIAMELVLTGDPITAQRAYELGLINRIVEPGASLDEALKLAQVIAANGPMAISVSKQIMMESADWQASEAFARQKPIIGPVFASEDAREGALAFAQKRAPVWKGK